MLCQNELQSLKKEIASNKVAIDQAYEARDAAQYAMIEIQDELKMTKADVEDEWASLANSMQSLTLDASRLDENDLIGSTAPDVKSAMNTTGMSSLSGSGKMPGRTSRSKSIMKLGADKSGGGKKLSKQQKLALLEAEWNEITNATGMMTPEEIIAFFKTAEEQVL